MYIPDMWPVRATLTLVLLLPASQGSAQKEADEAKPVANAKDGSGKTRQEAEALVEQALAAGLAGKPDERRQLLEKALALAPRLPIANWHLGRVRWKNAWRSVEEVQTLAVADKDLAAYRERRAAIQDFSFPAQHELATWCRKHRLPDEALTHWLTILEFDPTNAEAQKSVGLFWYDDHLCTRDEIVKAKRDAGKADRALNHWKPKLASWCKEMDDRDEEQRKLALEKIAAIDSPEVIPAFEQVLRGVDPRKTSERFATSMVDALAKLPGQDVAEALVRQASLSSWQKTQQTAIEALKQRDLFEFVPYALSNMLAPLKMQYKLVQGTDEAWYYEQTLYREGAEWDDFRINRAIYRPQPVSVKSRASKDDSPAEKIKNDREEAEDRAEAEEKAREAAEKRAHERVRNDEYTVKTANAQAAAQNEMLRRLLADCTKVDKGIQATAWWDWWIDFNELNYPAQRPIRTAAGSMIHPQRVIARTSCCFVAGTKICALTGDLPVEDIRPGDRVLAQDPISGELAFKVVRATSVRDEAPLTKIDLGNESLVCTRGHRFWVVGKGWKMAKHLKAGDVLHGIGGTVKSTDAEELPADKSYSLEVDAFHTYCVGTNRLLVHDNTAPILGLGSLPGVPPESPAPPAE